MSSLKEKTAHGLFWGSVSNGAQQLLNLVFGIALGRLLNVEDYGMVGQLAIFALLASTLQESGFTAALANRPQLAHRDYNAVFWFVLPVSLLLYGLLYFLAPWIADFYGNPQLTPLARYSFLSFVISGLGIVPSARLFSQMKVRLRTLSNLMALFISGCVGVVLAWQGFAYWGIATQTLVYVGINTLLYWYWAQWHPTLEWNMQPVREMLGFSSRLLLTSLLSHVNNNFFSVFLGRIYDERAVGNYNQANKWNFMGHGLVSGVVQGVAQPLFVETRDNEEQQRRVFRKMLRFTAFLSFPVMLGLSIIAQELIVLAIGEKWLVAADMLRWLCVSGAFLPLATLYTQFLLSKGRSDLYLKGLFLLVIVQLVTALVTYPFGVMFMLRSYVLVGALWLLVWHGLSRPHLKLSFGILLRDAFPFLIIAAVTMLITHYLIAWLLPPLWLSLLGKIVVAALLYSAILWWAGAEILKESVAYLFRRKRKD